jgi:hypothetical protein
MNSESNTALRDFRLSRSLLGLMGFSSAVSAILSIWSAIDGSPWQATLSGMASICAGFAVWEMARLRLTIYADYLECVTGVRGHHRIDREDIQSIHCEVGSAATVHLKDGTIVALPSPGVTPFDVFRYLRHWFKSPEVRTET